MNDGYYKIIIVPPGKIGLDIQPAKSGGVVIKRIKPSCSFKDQVSIDDRIVTVDGRKVITATCLRGVNSNADRHLGIISKEADVKDATFQSLHIMPSTRRVVSIYSAAETAVSSSESESSAIQSPEKSLGIYGKTPAVRSRTVWPTRSVSCTDESSYNAARTVAPSLYSGVATEAPSLYTAGKTVAPSFADESVDGQKQKDDIPMVLEVKMEKNIYDQEVAKVENENSSRTTHSSRSTDVFDVAYVAHDEREAINEKEEKKRLERGGSSGKRLSPKMLGNSIHAGCAVTHEYDSNVESGIEQEYSYNDMPIGAQGELQDTQDSSGRGDDFGEIGVEQVLEAHNEFQDATTDAYSSESGIEQVYSDNALPLSKSNLDKGTRKISKQEQSRLKKLMSWRSKEPSSATSSETVSSSTASSAVSGSKNASTEITPPINNCIKDTSRSMWKASMDKSSGKTYYYHIKTKEVTWNKPTERTENAPPVSTENEKAEAERQEHDGVFFDLEIRRTDTNISALTGIASAREAVVNQRVKKRSVRSADKPINNVADLHEGMIGLCVDLDAVKSMDYASFKCDADKEILADDNMPEEKDDDRAVPPAVTKCLENRTDQLELSDESSAKLATHELNQDVECDEAQFHSSFGPNVEEVSSERTESPSTPRHSKISQVFRIFDKKVPQEPTMKTDQSVFSIRPANEESLEGEYEARLKCDTSNVEHSPPSTNMKRGMAFLHTPTTKTPSLRRTISFPSLAKRLDFQKPTVNRDVPEMTEGNEQINANCNNRNNSPKAADTSSFWYDDQSLNEAFADKKRGIIW